MIKGIDIEILKNSVSEDSLGDYILRLKASKFKVRKIISDKEGRKNLKDILNTVSFGVITYMCNDNTDKVMDSFSLCGVNYTFCGYLTCSNEVAEQYANIAFEDMPEDVQRYFDMLITFKDMESAEKARRIILENSYLKR